MPATPDLPNLMEPWYFRRMAGNAREKAAAIVPMSAMDCYSIAALQIEADTYDRVAEAEWTFDGLMAECHMKLDHLATLYGVKP